MEQDCNNCQGETCPPCNDPNNLVCGGCGNCAWCSQINSNLETTAPNGN